MKKSRLVVLAGVLIAASGTAVFAALAIPAQEASAARDPRQDSPMVSLVTAARVIGSERGFTGTIGARVESNLGFRVAGKIVDSRKSRCRWGPCSMTAGRPVFGSWIAPPQPYAFGRSNSFG